MTGKLGISWRFALAAVQRRPAATVVQLVSLAVGLMALLLLTVTRTDLVDAWRDSKAGEERLVELKGENARLRDAVEQAGTTATLEREARKLGMVKPGERAYVIEGLDEDR